VNWGEAEQRQIQHIQPDYWLITLIAMVMPVPDRCNDNITSDKRHLLAFDCCETFTIYDEASSEGKMSMCWGCFTRVDDLKTSINSICCVW
jgi:hypothetical protein